MWAKSQKARGPGHPHRGLFVLSRQPAEGGFPGQSGSQNPAGATAWPGLCARRPGDLNRALRCWLPVACAKTIAGASPRRVAPGRPRAGDDSDRCASCGFCSRATRQACGRRGRVGDNRRRKTRPNCEPLIRARAPLSRGRRRRGRRSWRSSRDRRRQREESRPEETETRARRKYRPGQLRRRA